MELKFRLTLRVKWWSFGVGVTLKVKWWILGVGRNGGEAVEFKCRLILA